MSWGVATQNGVSVSLASIVSLSCGATEFSPASLFTSGVAGAWYDPSDYSTLFQDSAGTTPVTAVEQPVGLMLDKSQGLVLGSELVTTTNMVAQNANGTVSAVGSTLVATCTVNGLYGARFNPVPSAVVGRNYQVIVTISTNSANKTIAMDFGGYNSRTVTTSTGTQSFTLSAISGTTCSIYVSSGVAGESFTISNISIKELPGNHASQATAASRPVLRARYNLLTYSEQFNNVAWVKAATSVTTNSTTAPDGTTTADTVTADGTSAQHYVQQVGVVPSGASVTISIYVKKSTANFFHVLSAGSGTYAQFDLATGALVFSSAGTGVLTSATATDAENGWWKIVVVTTQSTGSATNLRFYALTASSNTAGPIEASTASAYIWGADLRTGSSAGTYQRIAAATDYATAGFLPYLYFVTDDSFGTNSIDFTSTNAMSVVTGYTKLTDTAVGMLYELGIDPTTTNGTFNFVAPQSTVDGSYRINVRGTTTVQVNTAARAAPVTDVSSLQANIAGPSISLRLNGAVAASSTSSMGTGNFANSALYIGRRNNSNFPINGNFYQMVVCGKTLSASELASTEAYVATKTGVTL